MYVCGDAKIVYHTAAVGVVLTVDPAAGAEQYSQDFHLGHDAAVSCLSLSADRTPWPSVAHVAAQQQAALLQQQSLLLAQQQPVRSQQKPVLSQQHILAQQQQQQAMLQQYKQQVDRQEQGQRERTYMNVQPVARRSRREGEAMEEPRAGTGPAIPCSQEVKHKQEIGRAHV